MQKNKKIKKQRGSALLYTMVLLGALMIVGELAFSYVAFSLTSRRESYNSQVNYWLAWGGVETALFEISNYTPNSALSPQGSNAFLRWPDKNENIIENPLFSVLSIDATLFNNSDLDYNSNFSDVFKTGYIYNKISVADFSQQKNTVFSINKDESKIFDLSKFDGNLKIDLFFPAGNNADNNLLWLRGEKIEAGGPVIEKVIKINSDNGSYSLSFSGDETFPEALATDPACSLIGSEIKCSLNFNRNLANKFRFFKIKLFGDDDRAEINFTLENGFLLGMPDSIIHSIGQMGANEKNKKEIFVKFPNQLKSISDLLDFSLYQSNF